MCYKQIVFKYVSTVFLILLSGTLANTSPAIDSDTESQAALPPRVECPGAVAKEGYNIVAPGYDIHAPNNPMLLLKDRKLSDLIDEAIRRQRNRTYALDLGTGTGSFLPRLSRAFKHVLGLDISEEMVKIARQRTKKDTKVHVSSANVLAFNIMAEAKELAGLFKFVHCAFAMKYFKSLPKLFSKLADITAKDSTIVIVDTSDEQMRKGSRPRFTINGKEYRIRSYIHDYQAVLEALDKAGFEVVESGYVDFDPSLKEGHPEFEKYNEKVLYYFIAKKKRAPRSD